MIADQPSTAPVAPASTAAHYIALAAAVFTWPLLLVGGYVSVHRLGMAVPDWPTTFGLNMFYYNMFEAPWGVFAEHSHRLYGSLVGLACLAMASYFSIARCGWRGLGAIVAAALAAAAAAWNPPGSFLGTSRFLAALGGLGFYAAGLAIFFWWTRRDLALALAWGALAAVVLQGILGGSRVTLNSPTFALIHGVFGQLVFVLLVTLWVVTSSLWTRPTADASGPDFRRTANATLALVLSQLILGAWVRHFPSQVGVLLHGGVALGVVAHVLMLWRSSRTSATSTSHALSGPICWMAIWTAIQIALGATAAALLWPWGGAPRAVTAAQALVRIGHQGAGALLLASSTVLALRAGRLCRGRVANAGIQPAPMATARLASEATA